MIFDTHQTLFASLPKVDQGDVAIIYIIAYF